MLLYISIIAAVLILPVALRFYAEPDNPGNETVHHSDDAQDEPDPGDVLITVRQAA